MFSMLMVDGSDSSILNLKIQLYCFEWLSSLKINFHKSEIFAFGMEQSDKERVTNMLNCKLSQLHLNYLGILVSDHQLVIVASSIVLIKMIKRLDLCKSKNLTYGGKPTLKNSCLTSLPMCTMGFYLLPKRVHKKMDKIISRFFWRGVKDVNKYQLNEKLFAGLKTMEALAF